MQIISTTFAFLLLLAIFSYTQMQQLHELKIIDRCFSESLAIQHIDLKTKLLEKANQAFNQRAGNHEDEETEEEEQKSPKQKPTERRTRFLTIFTLIPRPAQTSDPNAPMHSAAHIQPSTTPALSPSSADDAIRAQVAMKLLTRLIDVLYENKPFFRDASMNRLTTEDLVKLFFVKAEVLAKNNRIQAKLDLANVIVENPIYEDIIYKMLKGNNAIKKTGNATDLESLKNYDSLLDYISLKKREPTLMSVYLAPEPLLLALFQDPAIVEKVVEARDEIYEKLTNKEDDSIGGNKDSTAAELLKHSLGEQFKLDFARHIPRDIDVGTIDFGVSKTRP